MYRGGRKESERQGREGKEGERGTGRGERGAGEGGEGRRVRDRGGRGRKERGGQGGERGGQLLTISSLYGRINFQVLSQVDGLIQKQPHKLDNFPRP